MAHYLAGDIRMRMIGAVEGGMSRNGAAKRFGVSAANVMCWMDEYLRCGRTARLCSVRSGNLASPRAGVYPGAGRSVILVIHVSHPVPWTQVCLMRRA